jgi:predicted RNA-binding protein YlqC (UPF0109 family)
MVAWREKKERVLKLLEPFAKEEDKARVEKAKKRSRVKAALSFARHSVGSIGGKLGVEEACIRLILRKSSRLTRPMP